MLNGVPFQNVSSIRTKGTIHKFTTKSHNARVIHVVYSQDSSLISTKGTIHKFTSKSNNALMLGVDMSSQLTYEQSFVGAAFMIAHCNIRISSLHRFLNMFGWYVLFKATFEACTVMHSPQGNDSTKPSWTLLVWIFKTSFLLVEKLHWSQWNDSSNPSWTLLVWVLKLSFLFVE